MTNFRWMQEISQKMNDDARHVLVNYDSEEEVGAVGFTIVLHDDDDYTIEVHELYDREYNPYEDDDLLTEYYGIKEDLSEALFEYIFELVEHYPNKEEFILEVWEGTVK